MSFTSSDENEEEVDTQAFSGLDFDPNDAEQIKVYYDVSVWDFEQRAELSESLAEQSVPHAWAGDELVVPEEVEGYVDALFERLEAELGPFPAQLATDENGTEFGLDEWPAGDLEILRAALTEAEIPHRWEGSSLVVATDAEDVVDDLLDAIEAGDVATMDGEAPEGVLNDLYRTADQLVRQPTSPDARERVLALAADLSPTAPPFGLAVGSWRTILARTQQLVAVFESGEADEEAIGAAASDLREACRLWV